MHLFSNFFGEQLDRITAVSVVANAVTDPLDSTCSLEYGVTGGTVVSDATTNTLSAGDNWCDRPANVALHEYKLTVNSGTLTSGTSGSWINGATGATWTVARTTPGVKTANVTIDIRNVATTAAEGSVTFVMSATVNV